ncbi:class III lanthipeptide [Streptomyces sp. URMC 124]|uniref:class III lanthipeptide n=1 Tax=Streptomyces sp. URMC 124 TaxID=3423405 RepID=UPI003F1BB628
MGDTTATGPSLGQLKDHLERASKAVNDVLELQKLAPGAADDVAAAGQGSTISIGCSTASVYCRTM